MASVNIGVPSVGALVYVGEWFLFIVLGFGICSGFVFFEFGSTWNVEVLARVCRKAQV